MIRSFLPLASFLALVEDSGAIALKKTALSALLGRGRPKAKDDVSAILSALAEARILREGPLALTYECGEPGQGCEREVRDLGARGRPFGKRWIAVCAHSPRVCETVDVEEDSLREVAISVSDLARVMGELLGVADRPIAPSWAKKPRGDKSPRSNETIVIGEQVDEEGRVRDVIWLTSPDTDSLETLLHASERLARPTLVLVGTSRFATPDLRARHGPGAHVELDVIADWLVVEKGTLALAPRLRGVPVLFPPTARRPEGRVPASAPLDPIAAYDVQELGEPPSPAVETKSRRGRKAKPKGAIGANILLPTAKSWREVTMTLVDGETVSVRIGDRFQRLSYIDLGLATGDTRKATVQWRLLVACCEGNGTFRWKVFGSFEAARQVVSRLRKALKAAFGIDDNPFEDFSYDTQWKTRFTARAEFGGAGR